MSAPQIVETIAALRTRLAAARGARIGLVPTMGALHEGHLSLVRETRKRADTVVVSIFVNPAQFAPHEDFDRYPRTLEADAGKLAAAGGTDLIFAPPVGEMYPRGYATTIEVGGPSRGLETDFRPHFFAGVATIVTKLLLAVMPDMATFGEKDYQQLLVVRRLAADLGLATEIVGAAIIRESDGLAMSSRNAYLTPDERRIAGQMNVVLKRLAAKLRNGEPIAVAEADGRRVLLNAGFASVDYVAVRDTKTLEALTSLDRPARILAAAKVGGTRLIDNMAV
ncbi:MAG: pantoate--beta-alanine ligase [Alphaproteobacteria bacterium]|nr:pantoate--beta-alanine ligase [Alphaproteobacteria bacterium]MDE2630081.1 pantoate--beta-alanine ligase [Alphaproteobacteria bacterium]